jgi:hypothetical protein
MNNSNNKQYRFKLYFDSKKDAKLFMKLLPSNARTEKVVIGNSFRVDLYKNILEVESNIPQHEFETVFN